MVGTLGRQTIELCHLGTTKRFLVAVPEASCPPHRGLGRETARTPQRDLGRTDRMLMLCPAPGLGLVLSHVALAETHAVAFGGGREWGGGWEAASFSALSHLRARIQTKFLLMGGCSSTYPALPIRRVPRHFRAILKATPCI